MGKCGISARKGSPVTHKFSGAGQGKKFEQKTDGRTITIHPMKKNIAFFVSWLMAITCVVTRRTGNPAAPQRHPPW